MSKPILTSDEFVLPLGGPISSAAREFFGALHGHRAATDLRGVQGCAVQLEAALIREGDDPRFDLVVRFGTHVVTLAQIPVYAPEIAAMRDAFTDTGPSSQQLHQQRVDKRRREEQRERDEQERLRRKAELQRAKEEHEKLRREAEVERAKEAARDQRLRAARGY